MVIHLHINKESSLDPFGFTSNESLHKALPDGSRIEKALDNTTTEKIKLIAGNLFIVKSGHLMLRKTYFFSVDLFFQFLLCFYRRLRHSDDVPPQEFLFFTQRLPLRLFYRLYSLEQKIRNL